MTELIYHTVACLLKPDFETGKLAWLPRTPDMFATGKQVAEHSCNAWNTRYAGKEAFTAVNGSGYLCGAILGRTYRAHRIIWLLHSGEWPSADLDHINGRREDNRIINLRAVSRTENLKNQRLSTKNTSGVLGVCWHKSREKWAARINVSGRKMHIGYFESFDAAVAARKAANIEYGFHENHGRN